MEQGTSKTPCRRIGLRRITSASKSDPTMKSAVLQHQHQQETIKSRVGLFLTGDPGSSNRDVHSHSPQSTGESPAPTTPTDSIKSAQKVESTPQDCVLSSRKRDPKFAYPSSSPCSSRSSSMEDSDNSCQEKSSKKPKLDMPETITVEDLHTLQRKVGLKERRLKELRQAEIICKKHNPDDLRRDIKVWLQACQGALQELIAALHSRGADMNMSKLLSELGIPSGLVRYNNETDEFD